MRASFTVLSPMDSAGGVCVCVCVCVCGGLNILPLKALHFHTSVFTDVFCLGPTPVFTFSRGSELCYMYMYMYM